MASTFSVQSATANSGDANLTFKVTRSGTSSDLADSATVDYSTSDVTAVAGTDYTATSGSLSFGENVTETSVSVAILSEAYDGSAILTFLLGLAGFGAATGSINPSSVTPGVQTYLYIPQSDESTTIPTSSDPGINLKWQADYSGFADPSSTTVEMPLAYIRFGETRADMNDYERVVVNSEAYVPDWFGHRSDGEPREIGNVSYSMLPRGIFRRSMSDDEVADAMKNNAHLDGVFVYSDNNYTVTVKQHMNQIIQGDYVNYVEGRSSQLIMGPDTKWSYYNGSLRSATGIDHMYGSLWEYDIGGTRKLSIAASALIDYQLDASFSAFAGAQIELNNGLKASTSNSIDLSVKGLQAAIEADVTGEFDVDLPGSGLSSTKTSLNHSVSESITLSVDSGLSTSWTAPVAAAAIASATAALGATSAGWVSELSSDRKFFHQVTGDGLAKDYAELFTDAVPGSITALAAVTATVTVLAAAAQKKAQVVPSVMPKLEMNATSMTLSCGGNSIAISDEGILVLGDSLIMDAETVEIESDSFLNVGAATITCETDEFNISGNLSVAENVEVMADVDVMGFLNATFVEAV